MTSPLAPRKSLHSASTKPHAMPLCTLHIVCQIGLSTRPTEFVYRRQLGACSRAVLAAGYSGCRLTLVRRNVIYCWSKCCSSSGEWHTWRASWLSERHGVVLMTFGPVGCSTSSSRSSIGGGGRQTSVECACPARITHTTYTNTCARMSTAPHRTAHRYRC